MCSTSPIKFNPIYQVVNRIIILHWIIPSLLLNDFIRLYYIKLEKSRGQRRSKRDRERRRSRDIYYTTKTDGWNAVAAFYLFCSFTTLTTIPIHFTHSYAISHSPSLSLAVRVNFMFSDFSSDKVLISFIVLFYLWDLGFSFLVYLGAI